MDLKTIHFPNKELTPPFISFLNIYVLVNVNMNIYIVYTVYMELQKESSNILVSGQGWPALQISNDFLEPHLYLKSHPGPGVSCGLGPNWKPKTPHASYGTGIFNHPFPLVRVAIFHVSCG